MSGGVVMGFGYRQYRCEMCGTTSPGVLGEVAYRREQQAHRDEFHGGHTPDGERIIEFPPFRFFDLPRVQQIVGPIVLVAFALALFFRFR